MKSPKSLSASLLDFSTFVLIVIGILVGAQNLRRTFTPVEDRSQILRMDVPNWSSYANSVMAAGEKSASVTIVEFSDYSCAYCKKMVPILRELRRQYPEEIRFVYRHAMLRPGARPAALATVCAARAGKGEEMHDVLFEANGNPPENEWNRAALKVGITDTTNFNECLLSDAASAAVTDDSLASASLGIRGTPTFLLNDVLVEGSLTAKGLKQHLGFGNPLATRLKSVLPRLP